MSSNKINSDNAESFVLNFFKKVNDILDKKKGGKRKINKKTMNIRYKKQRGGGLKDGLLLPVPLNSKNISKIKELREDIQSSTFLQQQFRIKTILDSNEDVNVLFSKHITELLSNIQQKTVLEMTPEELNALSLFVNFQKMLPDLKKASEQSLKSVTLIQEISQSSKTIIEDDKSEENIQMVNDLLKNVSGPSDLVDRQTDVIKNIIDNTIKDTQEITVIYESNSSSEENLSSQISLFINCFGRLTMALSLLNCYKNRVVDYSKNLKTNNPILFFIMNSLYFCISFTIYSIFNIFKCLINTYIGKAFVISYFIYLYKQDNKVAVFIADVLLKLLSIADEQIGATQFINSSLEFCKEKTIEMSVDLLRNASIHAMLSSVITSAFASPEFIKGFVNNLSPEIASHLLETGMPVVSDTLKMIIKDASSEITQNVGMMITDASTQVTTNIVSQLATPLIEGVTQNMGMMITDATTQIAANTVSQIGTQQTQDKIMTYLTDSALKLGITAITSYLGAPNTGNLLTTGGSKRIRKNIRSKKKLNCKSISKSYKNK